MKDTLETIQESNDNGEKNVIPFQGSQEPSKELNAGMETSGPLSRSLAEHLFEMSKKVIEKNVTPVTVDASIKCCETLLKLMKFNYEIKKK